jgi:hypothetical protein
LSPHLPLELYDRIIDHLHCDQVTLKTCALVCKSWLPASRYHLSQAFSLTCWNCERVLLLLESPLCTLKSCVHTLKIECSSILEEAPFTWVNEALLPCLGHLHSVKNLSLALYPLAETHSWDFSTALPNLECLTIGGAFTVLHPDIIIGLMNHYAVEQLSLSTCLEAPHTRELNLRLSSRLRVLELSASWLDYFSQCHGLSGVDALKLYGARIDLQQVDRMLRKVAESLLHLSIEETGSRIGL